MKPIKRWQWFLTVGLVCVAGAVFLHVKEILPLFYSLGLAGLTVLLPLAAGLWVYKGRAARFLIILAGIAMLCGTVFLIDAMVTQDTFRAACAARGPGHNFLAYGMDYGYGCSSPLEPDYTHTSIITSDISAALYWPFVALLLGNALHMPYLLWRFVRRKVSRAA